MEMEQKSPSRWTTSLLEMPSGDFIPEQDFVLVLNAKKKGSPLQHLHRENAKTKIPIQHT
jgi:hypothetical protein